MNRQIYNRQKCVGKQLVRSVLVDKTLLIDRQINKGKDEQKDT